MKSRDVIGKPQLRAPPGQTGPQLIEDQARTRRGGPSRLMVQVRHNVQHITHLKRIVISQNAPDWITPGQHDRHSQALVIDKAPKGLQSILLYDTSCYAELWYKTATKGHRAKIFIRGNV